MQKDLQDQDNSACFSKSNPEAPFFNDELIGAFARRLGLVRAAPLCLFEARENGRSVSVFALVAVLEGMVDMEEYNDPRRAKASCCNL